jgi:cell division cycle 20-like protein 1 (cofactor of APC complex)
MLQVSTHDILENHVVIWKYPGLKHFAILTAHSSGVHYMAVSPDGQAIVSGGGDETLRLWNVFNKPSSQKVSA